MHIFLSYLIFDYANAIMSVKEIASTVSVNVAPQELRVVSKSVKVHTKTSLTEHGTFGFKSKKRSNEYDTDS